MRAKTAFVILGTTVALLVASGCSSGGSKSASSSSTTTSAASSAPGKSAEAVDLPAGWPTELALPAGTTVIQASQIGSSAKSMMVVARVDSDPSAAFDALKSQLTTAGYEIVGSTFTTTDKGGYGSISAKGTTYTAAIAFGPDETGSTNQITINVAGVEAS